VLGGVLFHSAAIDSKNAAEGQRPGTEFNQRASTFDQQRIAAIAGYSIGAAAIGFGLYLLLRDKDVASRMSRAGLRLASPLEAASGSGRP
jgi:hypothetical protein